ncbi:MAG: hypothetical protein HY867_19965 [Chloroflexi bacterium]|nr:hypothetical protein [Chloroflexota bacterium]
MKKQITVLVAFAFVFSLACQAIMPPQKRGGTIVSDCADIVHAVAEMQSVDVPQKLMDTGKKQGGEFDANDYFKALTHLSMRDGYALDYVYPIDFLGSFPMLYPRPVDQPPYASAADVPEGVTLGNFRDQLAIEDVEQGYFEYVVMDIMASQFYLVWHANYNDLQIICDKDAAIAIVDETNSQDFGAHFDLAQQTKVRALTNVEPSVKLTDDTAIVEVVTFTKWGGFFKRTYTISRSFPHEVDVKDENLVEYDCGIMF